MLLAPRSLYIRDHIRDTCLIPQVVYFLFSKVFWPPRSISVDPRHFSGPLKVNICKAKELRENPTYTCAVSYEYRPMYATRGDVDY